MGLLTLDQVHELQNIPLLAERMSVQDICEIYARSVVGHEDDH